MRKHNTRSPTADRRQPVAIPQHLSQPAASRRATSQSGLQLAGIMEDATLEYEPYLAGVANVRQGIGTQENHVCDLPRFDGTQAIVPTQYECGF